MKRITIALPEDLAGLLEHEAATRDTSVSEVVRSSLRATMLPGGKRALPFAAICNDAGLIAAASIDDALEADWANEPIAIVDSGPLLAAANRADTDHRRCVAVLERADLRLVIPALCIAEVTYVLGRRLGPAIDARFLRGLAGFDTRAPRGEEWARVAALVERYGTFPGRYGCCGDRDRRGAPHGLDRDARSTALRSRSPPRWRALRLLPEAP